MKVNINNASDNSKAAIPVNLLFTKARTKRNNAIRKGNIEIANSKIDNSVAANFHWSMIIYLSLLIISNKLITDTGIFIFWKKEIMIY